jgi:hypothetical protein
LVTAGVGPSVTVSTLTPSSWVGTPITFTTSVTSGSGNYSYAWSFGDGGSANGSPADHAFGSAGTYLVLVEVTDRNTGGVTQRNLTEVVYALPSVSISTSAGPNGSASYSFRAVTSGGSGPLSVVWAFGDGTVGHGKTVQHDFGSSGPYTVSVIATDPASRAAYANLSLNVFTGGGSSSGGPTISPGILALLIVLAALAVLFLVGMAYYQARSREPREPPVESTRTTAIEPVEETPGPPPET